MTTESSATFSSDRVFVVAGDIVGFGERVATCLLSAGATVVLAATDKDAAERGAADAFRLGTADRLTFQSCDISDADAVASLCHHVLEDVGQIHGWVNCVNDSCRMGGAFADQSSNWEARFETSLRRVNNVLRCLSSLRDQPSECAILQVVIPAPNAAEEVGCDNSVLWHTIRSIVDQFGVSLAEATRLNAIYIETAQSVAGDSPRDAADTVQFALCNRSLVGESIVVQDDVSSGKTVSTDPFDPAIAKRLASAGFEPHDIGPRYWQQPYVEHYPSLERLADASANDGQKTIVVTGASRGLGLALCREFDRNGHRIVGCARSEASLAAVERELDGQHHFRAVDISDDVAVQAWAEEATGILGPPDLVLNNAAVTAKATQTWRVQADEFERLMRINVLGSVNVLRHFIPGMIRRRQGVLVNFSSAMGRMASEKSGPYCASKWAIEGLTLSVAQELPPQLAAVTLHPGNIQTDSMQASFGESAALYPTAEQWARVAVPYLLSLRASDNGRQLSVPGMTAFRGIGPLV